MAAMMTPALPTEVLQPSGLKQLQTTVTSFARFNERTTQPVRPLYGSARIKTDTVLLAVAADQLLLGPRRRGRAGPRTFALLPLKRGTPLAGADWVPKQALQKLHALASFLEPIMDSEGITVNLLSTIPRGLPYIGRNVGRGCEIELVVRRQDGQWCVVHSPRSELPTLTLSVSRSRLPDLTLLVLAIHEVRPSHAPESVSLTPALQIAHFYTDGHGPVFRKAFQMLATKASRLLEYGFFGQAPFAMNIPTTASTFGGAFVVSSTEAAEMLCGYVGRFLSPSSVSSLTPDPQIS